MPQSRYNGPPMSLGNMRENGVRSLAVTCELPPRNPDECGRIRRRDPCPTLRPAHGLHFVRKHRRIRPTELDGTSGAREPDRLAMATAMKEIAVVRLAIAAEIGAIAPAAPFVVIPRP